MIVEDQVTKFGAARRALLEQIRTSLASDKRFVAAWLAGSFGRGEADDFSDLDLSVVVASPYDKAMCARLSMIGAGTIPERLSLIKQFGNPAVIHENHHNAPEGGSFTFVLYRESALVVDWTLIPHALASRPIPTLLLFDKVGIQAQPAAELESPSQRVEMASERVAFFWMISAAAARALLRKDAATFYTLLGMLHDSLEETRRLIAGQPKNYRRRQPIPQADTSRKDQGILRKYMSEMEALMPSVMQMGGIVPVSPAEPVDIFLKMAED